MTAHDALVENGAMGQLLLFIGLAEMVSWIAISQMLQGSGRKPGDFGLDPLNMLKGKSEAEVERMQVRELKVRRGEGREGSKLPEGNELRDAYMHNTLRLSTRRLAPRLARRTDALLCSLSLGL